MHFDERPPSPLSVIENCFATLEWLHDSDMLPSSEPTNPQTNDGGEVDTHLSLSHANVYSEFRFSKVEDNVMRTERTAAMEPEQPRAFESTDNEIIGIPRFLMVCRVFR